MATEEKPELITMAEAAKRFNVHVSALRQWRDAGLIREYRRELGKTRIFVDAREIERKLRPAPEGGRDDE